MYTKRGKLKLMRIWNVYCFLCWYEVFFGESYRKLAQLQQPQPAQQPGQAPNYQGLYDQYKKNNQNLNGQNPGQPGQR